MLKFKKTRAGEWVIMGTEEEIAGAIENGPVKVDKRNGASLVTIDTFASKVFNVNGIDHVYGHIAKSEDVREDLPVVRTDKARVWTPEQCDVIDAAKSGESFSVQACAGAGKTTVLVEAAKSIPGKVVYTAFNKAIVQSGKGKFGENVNATTMHALALSMIDKDMRARFERKGDKMRRRPLAQWLKLEHIKFQLSDGLKVITAEQQAGMVIKALSEFCKSGDPEPTQGHVTTVPNIDDEQSNGKHNSALAKHIATQTRKVWADLSKPYGEWTYTHAHYLKHFSLSGAVLPIKCLMVDEAQDLSPVMIEIVRTQLEADVQVILVGDSYQAINGFTGAQDAMKHLSHLIPKTLYLSQSWRFGEAIAEAANEILKPLGCPYTVKGNPSITSTFGASEHEPTMILCRSNASAMRTTLDKLSKGVKVRLMGADKEVAAFCHAAIALQNGQPTDHPEMNWANTWNDVVLFAQQEDGADIKLSVELVQDFGAQVILAALGDMAKPEDADLIVSTAHKTKGLESAHVKLDGGLMRHSDELPMSTEEAMLGYVAITRGQLSTDATATDFFGGKRD